MILKLFYMTFHHSLYNIIILNIITCQLEKSWPYPSKHSINCTLNFWKHTSFLSSPTYPPKSPICSVKSQHTNHTATSKTSWLPKIAPINIHNKITQVSMTPPPIWPKRKQILINMPLPLPLTKKISKALAEISIKAAKKLNKIKSRHLVKWHWEEHSRATTTKIEINDSNIHPLLISIALSNAILSCPYRP